MKEYVAEHLKQLIIAALSLFSGIVLPVVEVLAFAGFMILCDTATGIWAAKRRKELIRSNKLKRVCSKLIVYPLAIIIASWAERILPEIPFIKGAATLLIVIEGKSVLENFNDVLGYNFLKIVQLLITDGRQAAIEYKIKQNDTRKYTKDDNQDGTGKE